MMLKNIVLRSIIVLFFFPCIVKNLKIKTSTTEFYLFGGDYLNIRCNHIPFYQSVLTKFTQTVRVKTVRFIDCYTPVISYAAILKEINVSLMDILRLEVKMTSNQAQLTGIHFRNLTIKELSIHMLTENKKTMNHIDIRDILQPLVNLTVLDMESIKIPAFSVSRLEKVSLCYGLSLGEFGDCSDLKELKLIQWNWYKNQIPERWLTNCSQLNSITIHDVDSNLSYKYRNVIEDVHSLKQLTVSVFEFEDKLLRDLFSNANNLKIKMLNLTEWRREHNHRLSLRNIEIDSLEYLYFESNNVINIQGLPKTHAGRLTVDLTMSTIGQVGLTKSDYDMLSNNNASAFLKVGNLILECNECQLGWLSRAVREGRLTFSISKVICADGRELLRVPEDTLECDRIECEDCECTRRWRDNMIFSRCGGNATRIPNVWGLKTLFAAGNRIETVSADDLPDTLLYLDLSDNLITNMDPPAAAALFSNKERRLRLCGNPLVCICENHALLEALQTHHTQVEDYNDISCAGEGPLIRDVDISNLCQERQQLKKHVKNSVILAMCAIFIGLLSIATALYCRFGQEIKECLFDRCFCLQFLKFPEELDADRTYDAFVSYCHSDEEFIIDNLLPTLNAEYKLCLHYRDWVLGDFIPAQITRSVEQSRRTIIILSRSFAESVWGLLEFRTAHTYALTEGRARLIIIVIDDVVNDAELDSELRSYVRNYTYVRWGDKMFWEKLRYAMPHQKRQARTVDLIENRSNAVRI